MNKEIIIIGSGGHSKVVINSLKKSKHKIAGVIVKKLGKETSYFGHRILGDDEFIEKCNPEKILIVNGIGITPINLENRIKLNERVKELGFSFLNIIDTNAIIAKDSKILEGCQILAGSIIQPGVSIGKHTIVNTKASIDHDSIIAENCHIAPGVVVCGQVSIGKNTFIGAGTIISNNIEIGENCTIASGSHIFKNIDKNTKNY